MPALREQIDIAKATLLSEQGEGAGNDTFNQSDLEAFLKDALNPAHRSSSSDYGPGRAHYQTSSNDRGPAGGSSGSSGSSQSHDSDYGGGNQWNDEDDTGGVLDPARPRISLAAATGFSSADIPSLTRAVPPAQPGTASGATTRASEEGFIFID
jgi:hypothetical protein